MLGWHKVEGDANIHGHLAAAVPGTVAGLTLAQEESDTLTRQRALAPAITHAADGFDVSWHTALTDFRQGARASYEGAPARAIAAEMREQGSLISEPDLGAYQPAVVEPLRSTYRGYEVLTSPPASGGLTVLETLKLMEQTDLAGMGHNSAEAL